VEEGYEEGSGNGEVEVWLNTQVYPVVEAMYHGVEDYNCESLNLSFSSRFNLGSDRYSGILAKAARRPMVNAYPIALKSVDRCVRVEGELRTASPNASFIGIHIKVTPTDPPIVLMKP